MSSGPEGQFHISTDISWSTMAIGTTIFYCNLQVFLSGIGQHLYYFKGKPQKIVTLKCI